MRKQKSLFVFIIVLVIMFIPNKSFAESHDHKWNAGEIIVDPTCSLEGTVLYTCSVCGETKEEIIPSLGHIMLYTEERKPTCVEDGNMDFYTCARCLKAFSDNEGLNEIDKDKVLLKKTGHDLIEVEEVKPTCKKSGVGRHKKCNNCDRIFATNVYVSYPNTGDMVQVNNLELYASPWATKSDLKISGKYYIYDDDVVNGRIRLCDIKEYVGINGHQTGWVSVTGFTNTTYEDYETTLSELMIKPLEHNWGPWEDGIANTSLQIRWCTGTGSKHSEDRKIIDEYHVHTLRRVDYKESTCYEKGNIEYYYCSSCRRYYKDSEAKNEINKDDTLIPLVDHTWSDGVTTTEPTCTSQGIETYTCSVCGDTKTKLIPVRSRHYFKEISYKESTCTEAGNTLHYVCEICGKKYKDGDASKELFNFDYIIPVKGHNIVSVDKIEPTCEESGNIQHFKCQDCDELFEDKYGLNKISTEDVIIPAKEHDWDKGTVEQEASCTSRGSIVYTCKNDSSHQIWGTIPIKGHSCRKIDAKNASCTEDGNTEYWECTRCGSYFSDSEGTFEVFEEDITIKRNHIWDAGTITNPPTENETGLKTYTCTRCGETKNEEVGALGHDYKDVEGSSVEPTCTEDGKEADKKCTRCGDEIIGAVIKANGHKEEVIPAVAPTCIVNGSTAGKKCSVCGEILETPKKIGSLGHVYKKVGITAKEATCTEDGKEADKKCTRCGDVIIGTVIKANGHNPVVIPAVEPTYTSKGSTEGKKCSTCGTILETPQEIPMLVKDDDNSGSKDKDKDKDKKDDNSSSSTDNDKKDDSSSDSSSSDAGGNGTGNANGNANQYSNEWIDGKWYDEQGNQTYQGVLYWKCNSTGWWVEDSSGWYPVANWQKIDGIWYYFNAAGYMASNEYVDGYWLNGDGSCSNDYYLTWKSNSTGWWVADKSGWWPSSKWLKINGSWYYFNSSGYMVTSQYIDGYWIGTDGVCN